MLQCLRSRRPIRPLRKPNSNLEARIRYFSSKSHGKVFRSAKITSEKLLDHQYDAIIVGGGLVGVAISRLLALRNIKAMTVLSSPLLQH